MPRFLRGTKTFPVLPGHPDKSKARLPSSPAPAPGACLGERPGPHPSGQGWETASL